ncbi:hypothetical protein GGR57DRAFT_105596 [Xylariaceae sp. FL1272]|nr:hypothetical protein GGR57DRAFT_105596 [Xylariaceae sp. FL1272]
MFSKASLWPVVLVSVGAILWNYGSPSDWLAGKPTPQVACDSNHGYEIEFLSQEPLLMHVRNFLSLNEATYFTSVLAQNYTHRLYVNEEDVEADVAPRLAVLEQQDPFVKCVLNRAQRFLGTMGSPDFELLSLARYGVSHKVSLHADASPEHLIDEESQRPYNRRTSFFVYVHASDDLEGGETYFPRIPPPRTDVGLPSNSAVVSINNSSGVPSLAVKPISRSAVFWVGMTPDDTIDMNTIHKGLPVTKGEKIGMNIWAKYYLD